MKIVRQAVQTDCKLTFDCEDKNAQIYADGQWITEALINLVENCLPCGTGSTTDARTAGGKNSCRGACG